jgi:hypothetical protein
MSATAQNDRVNDLTLEDINAMVVDTANKSSEIMKRVVSRPEKWNGRAYQWPITTGTSSLGQSFKASETFDTTIDFAPVSAIIYPTGYAQPVGVSVVERSINSTPAGVVDLYQASYQYAQNSMITALGNIFYGVGNGNDFDGAGVIDDNGALTSSYAGLTRTAYPTINAFVVATSAGVIDLATMASADDGATISGDVSETPNIISSNQTVWSLYDSLLEPTSRAQYGSMGGGAFIDGGSSVQQDSNMSNGFTLRAGATSVTFRGKDYFRDQKALAGNMYFWNENWWHFKSLSLVGLNTIATTESVTTGAYDKYKVSAFQFRDMMMPVNQLSEVGIFVMYGNLYCENPNRNALISGITTT